MSVPRKPNTLDWISAQPWRKPVMLFTLMVVLVIVLSYVKLKADLPPNLTDVLKVLIYVCIGGYFGTSSIEAINGPKDSTEIIINTKDVETEGEEDERG